MDETGTKEPTILKRGTDRILIELPGLKEPSRIKKLLGKTANLTFKFASENDSVEFGVEKLFFEKNDQSLIVNKRVVISGENLIDAKPSVDNQSNETIVLFSLDRPGAIRLERPHNKM